MKVFEKGKLVKEHTSEPYEFKTPADAARSVIKFSSLAARVFPVRLEGTPSYGRTQEIALPPLESGYGPDTCVVITGVDEETIL